MALADGHKANFETLLTAFRAGDVALLECQRSDTGQHVPVVCAVNRLPDGEVELIPFASLFDGNPYEMLIPPDVAG